MILCFCDASFDPKNKIAVIAWKVGNNDMQHEIIHDTNNTRAEIIVLLKILSEINQDQKYIIYTDCASLLSRINSQDKIIQSNYKTSCGKDIKNADLYHHIFNKLRNNIQIKHIEGHLPTRNMNTNNIIFSQVDKLARKKLRQYISVNHP
ncbi:ribonuclease H [Acanthamoeba polyphaga mimivirus]|uniref:Ribonuclease H n=4 Tax=Megamimivirinae TaxID=3044648 RepID=A0A2L2DJY7_MIMIV|nr:ribonuclease H-like protein [Megavirus chiliensis]AFX92830.1 ribonuclease H-like protein [Megavirus courdo11]AGD92682.1 ribonuclease H-like protein [Megavirus lba]AVG46457.1 ribonuclease H [Acanthamoeba polyphaga mimivirus]AEQ33037.1 ribonuclease H-like protein [Megavirus chiliensis]AVG47570.1 ribonuclease H [Acanthamoeba polyphaga mimivirus]